MLEILKNGLSRFTKFIFSCAGSILMIVIYTILGGFVFKLIEKEQERRTKIKMKNTSQKIVEDLRNYILDSAHENVTLDVTKMSNLLIKYTEEVGKLKSEGWNGMFGDNEYNWTIEGSILFSLTVITTIGYGVTTPKTRWGKFLTIVYAIIGIPFTFLSLSNIGQHFSKAFCGVYLLLSKSEFLKKQQEKLNIFINNKRFHPKIQEKKLKKVTSKLRYKRKHPKRQGELVNWNNIDSDLFIYSIGSDESNSNSSIPEIEEDFNEWLIKNQSVNVSYLTYDREIPEETVKKEPEELSYSQVRIPIIITFLIMICYILIGALFFAIWEDNDYLKWAYFCFITLSTIGFGDIVPGTKIDSDNPKEKLIFVVFYVVVGLSVFSMCFKLMEEEIRYKWNTFINKIRNRE